jgi:hypothetical protein
MLCILSYGLLIPWLGFYWDDWFFNWVAYSQGLSGLLDTFAYDRPALAYLYAVTTSLLAKTPLPWHIFALLARWLSAVAVLWLLRGIWPTRNREVIAVAFLFAVYPGFTQQPISLIYSHVFLLLATYMFSLGAMVWAQKTPRLFWLLTLMALGSSLFSFIMVEYYIGLMLLRPVLLWIILTENEINLRHRLRRTLVLWSPYFAASGGYIIWRFFIFGSSRGATNQAVFLQAILANPRAELGKRIHYAFSDLYEAGFMAWTQTFTPKFVGFGSRYVWVAWAIVLISIAIVGFYLSRITLVKDVGKSVETERQFHWPRQAILFGLFAILCGGLIFWFANLQVKLDGTYDRYTLPLMLGSCILIVGLIELIIRTRVQRIIVISILVGLAVGFHFRNANLYRQDWIRAKDLIYQISWRMPGLRDGTSLLMIKPPLLKSRDYSLATLVNLTYAPDHHAPEMKYWVFILPNMLGDEVPGLSLDTNLIREVRNVSFSGSTNHSIVLWISSSGCLRVVDPYYDSHLPLPDLVQLAINVSNPNQVDTGQINPAVPPKTIFGGEPEHGWCYFYQKANLARQRIDWEAVGALGDEAQELGLSPHDMTEWLPFIEGYARAGRFDQVANLAEKVLVDLPALCPYLCNMIDDIESQISVPMCSSECQDR